MSKFLDRSLPALVLLCLGIAAVRGWSATPGQIDDSVAQGWYYSNGNQQMKDGHRQVRKWEAALDSARRAMKDKIYGKSSSSPSPVTGTAGRVLATTTTAPPTPLGTEASFAGGRLTGHWVLDRITNTTASGGTGSGVRIDRTVYDSATNTIHALTEEADLVSAPLTQMGSWKVVNQVVQIDKLSFTGVRTPTGNFRLLGIIGGTFQYSDDDGLTWTQSTGGASSSGSSVWTATLPDGEVLSLVARNSTNVLIRSRDQGATFQDVQAWPTSAIDGTWLYNTADVCFIARANGAATDVYKYTAGALALVGSIPTAAKVTSMTGTVSAGALRVYAHTSDSLGWSTTDGATWKKIGKFPDEIQTVVPDKPNVVISNAPQHDLTSDGGTTWASYPDNNNTIGWDPHHLTFYRMNGKWTLVAGNDMGLCFNSDPLNTATWQYVNCNHSFGILHGGVAVDNAALTVTENQDPGTFELTRTARDTFLANSRYGSDGLRGAASNGGKAYWYRHYWASFFHAYAASTGDSRTTSYDIAGDWYTPPFKGSTKSGEDAIWVSGWDHLIKLTYSSSSNSITRTDLPKNFTNDVGAVTIGVGVAKSDPSRVYVATRNGHFFWSTDTGESWTETTYSGTKPSTQWNDWNSAAGMYIEVGDKDPNLVFWGGGTGAAACLVSRDGGRTFTSTVSGLPSGSEIRNVSIAPDGKLAFSSNYQVWIAADNKWYDLRTSSMPSAALPAANSVYYLPLQRKVRYFTWGAGVVDLDITSLNTADNPAVAFASDSCYQLKSVSSGKALAATAAGSAVQVPFTGSTSQTWHLVPRNGFYTVQNTGSGDVLQVAAASFKENAPVETGAWSGGDNQQWNIVRAGANYALAARHSVKVLEIAGAATTDSAEADQGVYVEAANQQWSLVPTTTCGATPVRKIAPSTTVKLLSLGRGRFRIEGVESASVHVLAWDNSGRIAWRGTVANEVDLSSLARGVYHVRIWFGHLDVTLEAAVLP